MDDGFLLWPSNSNFDNFYFCLHHLYPSIRFTFEKAEIIKYEKGGKLQIFNFLDAKEILNKTTKVKNIYTINMITYVIIVHTLHMLETMCHLL